jgi:hypothetical protein
MATTKASVSEVRGWAKENGFEVSDRGRLPAEVWAAWETRTETRAMPQPRSDSSTAADSVGPDDLHEAQARIASLEEQVSGLTARIAALESRSNERRRRFVRSR